MHADDLPIYELFTRLQDAGLPLGLNEYAQAMKAIQAGFGLPDKAALSRLCRALWVKTKEEEYTFNYHFTEVIGAKSLSYAEIAKTNTQKSALYRDIVATQQITAQTNRHLLFGICLASVIFLAALAGLKFFPSTQDTTLPPEEPPKSTETEDVSEPQSTVPPTAIRTDQPQTNDAPTVPVQPVPEVSIVLLGSLAGVMLSGTGLSWLLIRRLTTTQEASSSNDSDSVTTQVMVSQTQTTDISDEVHLAEMIGTKKKQNTKVQDINVLGQDEYFPLTRRQMKQGWRHLRRSSREGPKTEFDIDGTINQISIQGSFLGPLMRAPRSNHTDLVFLLDQDGSMVPFQALSERLVNTAVRSGRLGRASIYYFHNCPVEHLYHDPLRQEPESLSHFLSGRLSSKSVVVIVSDAGAARGGFNNGRIQKTKKFLKKLNQHVRYVVWLNPLPQGRWEHTTANEIANFVSMFEVNRTGFQSAVDVLRGRWQPSLTNFKEAL